MPQREDCPRGSVREEQTTVIRGAQSDRVENALITDELLTIAQAADWLGTSVRFPRRLITERRITFEVSSADVVSAMASIERFAQRVREEAHLPKPVPYVAHH